MISDTNPGGDAMMVDDDHKEGGPVYGPALPSALSTENKETEKKNDEDEKTPYVWRIPNWTQVRAEYEGHNKYYSEEFEKCGYKWRLLMFPNGHPTDKNAFNHISCYVEIRSLKGFSDNAYFDFSLYVMHPSDESKVQRKESQHEFTMMEVDRGFSTLFNLKQQDEFLFDGNELRIALWLQKRINPWATTRYHDSNYDSKKSTGYVGIRNQGATCYMNSLLQTLFHIPAFRKAVYDVPTDHLSEKAIALALQRVFYNLQTSAAAVSTKQLTASFGWDSVDAFQQHDVQEFSRVLMDNLEEKMKKTAVEGMIQKLFEGKSQSYIECINVPFKSERICSFMDVALNVKGIASLEKSFENYVEVETLEKDNQYRAEGFGKQDARKGERFLSFPPVLQIQLKRFEYDPIRDMMVKVNDRFEFPTHVNLASFLPKDTAAETEYYLHSILVHSGSVHGGHYYAFIRPLNKSKPLADSPWYKFDDETVTKVEEDEAVSGSFGGEVEHTTHFLGVKRTEKRPRLANAYMLVYLRKDMVNQTASSADQILASGGVITPPTPASADVPQTVAADASLTVESKSDEGSKGEGGKEGSKEGESKEGEEKKKEDEATEAMKIVLDVSIPTTLVERFKQESIEAHQRSEQKKKAHLFMDIRVIAESKLFDIPVGVEFSKEYVDSNGLLQYSYDIETEVKVARAHTVEKFGEELQEMSGIPLSRQQYWKFTNRENGTRRPNGWIAISNEKVEEVWKDATLRRPTLWLKDTAFEAAVNQVNPNLFSTLNAANTANHEGGDRCIITFKYFDVIKQQLTVVSTAIFFKRDTIRDMKKYMRNVLRGKGLLGGESSDAPPTVSEVSAAVGELQIDEELQYPIIAWEEEDVAHNKITLLQDNKTLKDCGLRNGDLVVFQLNIPDNQAERLKQSHADSYQQWDQYINDWREKMKNNAKDGTKSNNESNKDGAAATTTAIETKLEHYPVKSEFFSDAPSYLKWLRDRIVIEFRQFPWRAHPSNHTKSHPDVHVFHLELNKNNKVIDIMQKVGTMFHIDHLKVKFYTHSAYALNGKPGPDTQPFMKKDVFKTSLIDYLGSADPIIYYEQTEFSLQELSINRVIPILFLEVENNFKEYKFNVLVNRKGKVAHLEQAVWQKLQTLGVKLPDTQTIINNNNNNNGGEESSAAAGGEGLSQQIEGVPQQQEGEQQQEGGGEEKEKEVKDDDDIPSVSAIPRYPLRFVMVNDRRISLYDDRQFGIDGVNHSLLGRDWLRVEIIPSEEQLIKDGGEDSVRWGAFFQPLSTGYRCFGHPFSFVVKKNDTVVDFRRTIAQRLNVSQEQADKFGIGLLNHAQYVSLHDTDIIMNKLDHSETLLIGIHDPERKPRGATGLTGGSWSSNNKSFFSRFAPANQAIKIYSTE